MNGGEGVNVPLLRKAVEWAEAEAAKPYELREWNQVDVRVQPDEREFFGLEDKAPQCGTCYCVAGWVVATQQPEVYDAAGVSVCETARDLLGLPAGHHLFAMDNTIEDVRRIAEDIAGERL